MDALEKATLNHSEIQKLVDVLLDKQKSADQWKTVSFLFQSLYVLIKNNMFLHKNRKKCSINSFVNYVQIRKY